MKKWGIILLTLSLLLALCACGGIDTEGMEQKTRAMLDCYVSGDEAGAHEKLYPGVTKEDFHKAFQEVCGYFPLTQDYKLVQQSYNISVRAGSNSVTVESAVYLLETGGKQFRISAVYQSDGKGEGFTSFEIARVTNLAS